MYNTWQKHITFTPDQLLIGTGWHEVEKDGQTFIRWSGPETTATIHILPCRDQGNRLNMTIHASAGNEILSALILEADETPLYTTISEKRNPAFVTAVIPADKSKNLNEPTILTLKLPKTLQGSQITANSNDNRKLGLAISRLEIFPLARPLFTARKYADPIPFDGINYIRHNPGVRDSVIHGLNVSAYDYFLKHHRQNEITAYSLHLNFDERPGDLYDILHDDMRREYARLEQKYQQEIKQLREMVYRQGDMIRSCRL